MTQEEFNNFLTSHEGGSVYGYTGEIEATDGSLQDVSNFFSGIGGDIKSGFQGFMDTVTSSIGKGASNIINPVFTQVVLVLVIGLVGLYLLTKTKIMKG
jgi:hypothetical protein